MRVREKPGHKYNYVIIQAKKMLRKAAIKLLST
jgi:hypothetical protein